MDHLYFWKGEGTLPHERFVFCLNHNLYLYFNVVHLSLPRFKISGGHEYEEKLRHEEAKERFRLDQQAKLAGGRGWQAAGRGSIRLDPGKILGRGRGEGTLGGARKFKITKGGATKGGVSLGGTTAPLPNSVSGGIQK